MLQLLCMDSSPSRTLSCGHFFKWSLDSNCPPDKAEGASLQALLFKQHMPNKSVLITRCC